MLMKKILLVDDDAICNFLSMKTMERLGFHNEIQTALNGKQALDVLKDDYNIDHALPDVIFLDLNMPIMGGFAFLEALQKANLPGKEKMQIIIVSSSEDPEDIRRSKEFGISTYLAKPLRDESLMKVLAEA
jgi:CheY-like chemotaxis protein